MTKKVLITGVHGQDGSYLADLLLKKGYDVYGMERRSAETSRVNTKHLIGKITFVKGDLTDQGSVSRIVDNIRPDEIYNLAAQSFVGESWNTPEHTSNVTGLGALRMLEAIRVIDKNIRFYQASSSEMIGRQSVHVANEDTPFYPRSPYGVAKLYAHWMTKNYRESYGMFCCSGILYNHESKRRQIDFVTRKITDGVARIRLGLADHITLGNIDARRDWGYAPDYCINLDVPILTTKGWCFYEDIKIGDSVINFDYKNNKLSTDIVLKKHMLNSNGDKVLLRGRGVNLNVTPNHRIIYQKKSIKSKGGWSDYKECTAIQYHDMINDISLRARYHYRLPHYSGYNIEDNPIFNDDQLYLISALLAEGHLKDNLKGRGAQIGISQSYIKNPKTHKKIEVISKALGLDFVIRNRNDGVTIWEYNARSSKEILGWFDTYDVHIMPSSFYSLSARQANIVYHTMMDCDGCWGSSVYTSKRYKLAVDFQTIVHITGRRTSKITKNGDCYLVCIISDNKKHQYVQESIIYNDGAIQTWCVTTKNGTIITRDDDTINISGNCKAMHLMLQQDKPDDYIIATNTDYSVKDFLVMAFKCIGITDWGRYVKIDEKYKRPAEVDYLRGDYSKAKMELGWEPEVPIEDWVHMMVMNDISLLSSL